MALYSCSSAGWEASAAGRGESRALLLALRSLELLLLDLGLDLDDVRLNVQHRDLQLSDVPAVAIGGFVVRIEDALEKAAAATVSSSA